MIARFVIQDRCLFSRHGVDEKFFARQEPSLPERRNREAEVFAYRCVKRGGDANLPAQKTAPAIPILFGSDYQLIEPFAPVSGSPFCSASPANSKRPPSSPSRLSDHLWRNLSSAP